MPGTPFNQRIMEEGLLLDKFIAESQLLYRRADGFTTAMKHPTLSPEEIEELQRWCFEQDFQRLGPSIFRVLEARLLGYQKLKDSPNPFLRNKAEVYASDLRCARPVFLAGRLLGPQSRRAALDRGFGTTGTRRTGSPQSSDRFQSALAVGAALWTAVTLKLDLFQHPKLMRTGYRMSAGDLVENRWEKSSTRIPATEMTVPAESTTIDA